MEKRTMIVYEELCKAHSNRQRTTTRKLAKASGLKSNNTAAFHIHKLISLGLVAKYGDRNSAVFIPSKPAGVIRGKRNGVIYQTGELLNNSIPVLIATKTE